MASSYRKKIELQNAGDSVCSVIVRSVDGNIVQWNRAAEHHYGWSKEQAVGNISHHLLRTVFPCPLETINQQLLATGHWEGELIHSLIDGSRVKVQSQWILKKGQSLSITPSVVEVNNSPQIVAPETAHFSAVEPNLARRLGSLLLRNWAWWVIPLCVAIGVFGLVVEFSYELSLAPISQ